jgi:hypothetical protein
VGSRDAEVGKEGSWEGEKIRRSEDSEMGSGYRDGEAVVRRQKAEVENLNSAYIISGFFNRLNQKMNI